ncbi:MAG: M55 family metallopeptidase [Oscillospiraceae bacterium]|jgi:D-amino peptidase|nr:M55 family metallopeptidase [Oscillospiraceae bacterium]
MKIYISSDMEGTAGIAHWDETEPGKREYPYFTQLMTGEVVAACNGAIAAGASEIIVKDAHDYARNIDILALPKSVKLLRGWTRDPLSMMGGLDKTFDGVMFTGYHSPAGSDTNPLSHTMNTRNNYVLINGERCSELMMNCLTASYFGVPVYFVAGDAGLCRWINSVNPNIETVETFEGIGDAVLAIHPELSRELIKSGVETALKQPKDKMMFPLPKHFDIEINFKNHQFARNGGFYPGVTQTDEKTVKYSADDYMDALKFFFWVL